MDAVFSLNADPFIAVGNLTKLEQFRGFATSKLAAGLPADFPMLSCPIADEDAPFIPAGVIRYRMNFGAAIGVGSPLMTMRLQINGAQIYWLADPTDPEVCAAFARWKRAGRVPISLNFDKGNERECTFCVPEISKRLSGMEDLREYAGQPLTEYVWKSMVTLSASGKLQRQATSDLPNVPLERVLVNLLVAERLAPFVRGRLHDVKPKNGILSFGLGNMASA
ncbi:hypothetical protein JYK05_14675 (plasmid) [Caballeronia sp. M1242]|nr:hypothetical protein JYK05_14675 [Caballeronia sp. M1242]